MHPSAPDMQPRLIPDYESRLHLIRDLPSPWFNRPEDLTITSMREAFEAPFGDAALPLSLIHI